uniref:Uncharacterized protein n=1 Tax=Haptolina brevifila TaxID=156173 RepID=A0A7S2FV62_9EUKA
MAKRICNIARKEGGGCYGGIDRFTTMPDDLVSAKILCNLDSRGLRSAVCVHRTFRARSVVAALAAAELMVPGIGPVAVRVDVDDRQHAVSKACGASGVEHRAGPSLGVYKSRLHLRTATASTWLFHLENQVRWVKWLSEHLAFGKRAPLAALPFLINWQEDPEAACARTAKGQPAVSADVGCERALLNLCDAPAAAIALHAVPVVLSLIHRNESRGVYCGSVRLLGALDPAVLHTHLPLLVPLLKTDADQTVVRLVLSAMRKCAPYLASSWLEEVVLLAIKAHSRHADELVVRTSAVRVLQAVAPAALTPHIAALLPLLSEFPRTRHVLCVAGDALLRGHDLSAHQPPGQAHGHRLHQRQHKRMGGKHGTGGILIRSK